ncbi:Gtpase-activating protein, partial [Globisporangium splendens]
MHAEGGITHYTPSTLEALDALSTSTHSESLSLATGNILAEVLFCFAFGVFLVSDIFVWIGLISSLQEAEMAFARLQRRGGDTKQQQQQSAKTRAQAPTERVGEILSDSNSELSSLDDGDEYNLKVKSTQPAHPSAAAASRSNSRNTPPVSSPNGSGAAANASNGARQVRETSGGAAKIRQLPTKASPGSTVKNPTPNQSQSQGRSGKGLKKTGSRKWYSDSENDDDVDVVTVTRVSVKTDSHKSHQENEQRQEEEDIHTMEDDDSDLEKFTSGSMVERRNNGAQDEPAEKNSSRRSLGGKKLKSLRDQVESPTSELVLKTSAKTQGVLSPQSDTSDAPSYRGLDPSAKKKTGLQKLVAKTFSPFSSRRKSTETQAMDIDNAVNRKKSVVTSPLSDASASSVGGGGNDRKQSMDVVGAARNPRQDSFPSSSEQSQREQPAAFNSGKPRSTAGDMISPQNEKSRSNSVNASSVPEPSGQLVNRRMSRLKQSPNGSEFGSVPRSLDSTQEVLVRRALENATAAGATPGGSEALSPGQRKLVGAFAGHPGSGVLLEGWLRQKQRRGMKGMKKWNARYFVLYAKTNEVRYYADVVQSAWGPIPLGEIGSISLRLIQRIGKPSHPKYRGCRFDITCRNSWGSHYADDYVSSDEENNNSNSANNNEEAKQERSSTPRSSRVYSLMADSPQTTVTWVNTLDSLLVRSANSPRPDMAPNATGAAAAAGAATTGANKTKRVPSSKVIARRRSSALETETMVLVSAGENVPRPVTFAIDYIFNSSPGIEMELFYQKEPEQARLKISLKFLNQFSTDGAARKPTKEELDAVLDPITAGAVVKLWLAQMEQPVVPFEMYADFLALVRDAKAAPFDLKRDLKALIEALPQRNLAMLACLLFHLNDVTAYTSHNGMDAALLSTLFAAYILRPRPKNAGSNNNTSGSPSTKESDDQESELRHVLVEEMIANVDAIIDEKAVNASP